MKQEITTALGEIFRYKELLKDVVTISMNTPDVYLDKAFTIYQEFVELVESFGEFSMEDINDILANHLANYAAQPFFPVIAGLFVTALANKILEEQDAIVLDLDKLCFGIVDDATKQGGLMEDIEDEEQVSFSLDFLGYLLPDKKHMIIKGPVGDYCGALMGKKSKLTLHGMHGHHFTYESDPTAIVDFHKV